MLSAGAWKRNQQNMILFVLVDSDGAEVSGLGGAFDVEISKGDSGFVGGAGDRAEIGSGWYAYTATAGEASNVGPVAVKITGAGVVQQNLEYVVEGRTILSKEFTYTVTSSQTGLPIDGVYVAIATQSNGANAIWTGFTDAFGVARDKNGNKPRLDPGNYAIFRRRSGFIFDDPDLETIAP